VTADADLASGTIVFSTEGATVVTDGSARRDARTPVGAGAGAGGGGGAAPGSRSSSPLDLPPTDRKRNDGELVN
jgi:hypothetical protein